MPQAGGTEVTGEPQKNTKTEGMPEENMDGQSEKIFSGKQRNDHSRTSLYEW